MSIKALSKATSQRLTGYQKYFISQNFFSISEIL